MNLSINQNLPLKTSKQTQHKNVKSDVMTPLLMMAFVC